MHARSMFLRNLHRIHAHVIIINVLLGGGGSGGGGCSGGGDSKDCGEIIVVIVVIILIILVICGVFFGMYVSAKRLMRAVRTKNYTVRSEYVKDHIVINYEEALEMT
jgi:hypothetical protein